MHASPAINKRKRSKLKHLEPKIFLVHLREGEHRGKGEGCERRLKGTSEGNQCG